MEMDYTEKHGLGSNYIWIIQEGRDGKMWFKIHMRAIDVQAISSFDGSVFKIHEDDTSPAVYDFKKGELIFDHYYDGKTMRKIELPHTSPIQNADNVRHHYDIYSSCIDRHGNAWFGACTAGICKYDGSNFTWFDNKELVSATRDMFEDHNGTVWAGNNGDGLFRFDGTNFINVSREHDLHNPDFEKYPIGKPGLMSRVWKITEDLQGDLWVATIDNGVWRLRKGTVTNYTAKDGLGMDNIWTVYCDKQGKIWVGTEGEGVYTFDGKGFIPLMI
jgi:ligand-binding sensor domain-containing protein